MNVFLQRSLGTIQTLILPPKLEIPPQGASIKEISKIAYRDLVEPVLQEALKKQTIPESIDRVDQGVKDYSLKMKETKINSPEYKAYRSARKELFSLRKEFVKDMKK